MLHLDPKEFTVEPSALQSLQQLIQWVADLALNLLARLPEQRMQVKAGGVGTNLAISKNLYSSSGIDINYRVIILVLIYYFSSLCSTSFLRITKP